MEITLEKLHHCSDPLGTESHNMQLNRNKGPKVDLLEAVYDIHLHVGIPIKSITIRNWFK